MRSIHPLNERADVRSEDAPSEKQLPSRREKKKKKKIYVQASLDVRSDVKSVKPTRYSLEQVKRTINKSKFNEVIQDTAQNRSKQMTEESIKSLVHALCMLFQS